MHEMAIAKGMLGILKRTMRENRVKRLKSVKIRVGELTAVEPEALRFCFDVSTKGTAMQGAKLEIETVPVRAGCLDCGAVFALENFVNICAACGGAKLERTSGTELEIVSMEGN